MGRIPSPGARIGKVSMLIDAASANCFAKLLFSLLQIATLSGSVDSPLWKGGQVWRRRAVATVAQLI